MAVPFLLLVVRFRSIRPCKYEYEYCTDEFTVLYSTGAGALQENFELLQVALELVLPASSFYVPHGAAGGTRVRANTSMLVLVHGPGSGSAALAAESLLNTGKCRCDAGKVYVRCLYRR